MAERAVSRRAALRGNLLLLLTALVWGTAFVAQSVGMDFVGPFTFNGIRSVLAGIVLIPVALLARRGKPALTPQGRKNTWLGGLCCGVALFAGSSFQQIGIQYTTAGKAGFITALYIVLVPLFGLSLGKRVRALVWVAVGMAVAGLYLLCVREGFTIERGDLYVLCCAVMFAVHILVIDYFSPRADCIAMSCIQFFVSGAIGCAAMLLFETPEIGAILSCWLPILYAGILSGGVGYTLQIVAQKDTNPTVASLLMSLESVFAALAGWALLGEMFTPRELLGCVLTFGGSVLAQLPERKRP